MTESVPEDYTPAPWVGVFTKRELQWLAERLDAANRQLRIVNRRLSEAAERREDPR